VYRGAAEAAAAIAREEGLKRRGDPSTPYLLGELANHLATAQLAADDMVRSANDLDVEASLETANAMLVRKTIVADAVLATAASTASPGSSASCATRMARSSIRSPRSRNTASPAASPSVSIRSATPRRRFEGAAAG